MIPIKEWPSDRNFYWVTDSVVLFRPAYNWDPNAPGGGSPVNATQMAAKINSLAIGSLNYVYVIQQTPFAELVSMTKQLGSHVKLVGYQNLVHLANQLK